MGACSLPLIAHALTIACASRAPGARLGNIPTMAHSLQVYGQNMCGVGLLYASSGRGGLSMSSLERGTCDEREAAFCLRLSPVSFGASTSCRASSIVVLGRSWERSACNLFMHVEPLAPARWQRLRACMAATSLLLASMHHCLVFIKIGPLRAFAGLWTGTLVDSYGIRHVSLTSAVTYVPALARP